MNILPYKKLIPLLASQDIKQKFLQKTNKFNFEYPTGYKVDLTELMFKGILQVEIKERNSYNIKFWFTEEGTKSLIRKLGKVKTQDLFAKIQSICKNKTEFTKDEFETFIQQILSYLKLIPGLEEIQDSPFDKEDFSENQEFKSNLQDVTKNNAKFKVITELMERANLENKFYPLFMYNWHYSWEYDIRYLDAVLWISKGRDKKYTVCLAIIKRDIKTGLGKMDETKVLSFIEFPQFTSFIENFLSGNDYKSSSIKKSLINQIFKKFKEETKIAFWTKKMGNLKDASSDKTEQILESIKQSDAEKEFKERVINIGTKLKLKGDFS